MYDDRIARDAPYPSESPLVGDSPEYVTASQRFKRNDRRDSPMVDERFDAQDANIDIAISFAPPGYVVFSRIAGRPSQLTVDKTVLCSLEEQCVDDRDGTVVPTMETRDR